jgi:prepilin-type processing-associated H-X9-DG protein
MKTHSFRSILLTLLLLPAVARAANDAAPIEPYIDQNTILVVRFDTAALDIPAFGRWMTDAMKAGGDPKQDPSATDTADMAQKWLVDFHTAGGGALFAVVNFTRWTQGACFYMAPVQPGSDPKAIQAAMATLPGVDATRVINNSVFAVDAPTLDQLQQFKPSPRPELAQAISDAGNSPLRVAIIPSDDIRKVFEAMAPQLPPQLGGGPITVLTHGLHNGSIAINPQSDGKLQIRIQSTDGPAANDMIGMIAASTQFLRDQAAQAKLPFLAALADELKPQVSADKINIDLSPQGAQQVGGALASSFLRARTVALRVKDASNIRQLMIACIVYGNKHQQQWPDSLEATLKDQNLLPSLLTNVLNPSRKPGFVYVKPTQPFGKVDPNTIVIYDAHDAWNGLNAGFADGHVEWVDKEENFKKQLANSTQPAAK